MEVKIRKQVNYFADGGGGGGAEQRNERLSLGQRSVSGKRARGSETAMERNHCLECHSELKHMHLAINRGSECERTKENFTYFLFLIEESYNYKRMEEIHPAPI